MIARRPGSTTVRFPELLGQPGQPVATPGRQRDAMAELVKLASELFTDSR